MKTNLEELNYRFRKELLNNYGYKIYYSLIASIKSCKTFPEYDYSAWVKGLFKKGNIDSEYLIDFLESSNVFQFEKRENWYDEYERGCEIDYINIIHLCSSWVYLTVQQNECDLFYDSSLWKLGCSIINIERIKLQNKPNTKNSYEESKWLSDILLLASINME